MVKMINYLFGNTFWVTEERVEEYLVAGHKLAASPIMPTAAPKKTTKKSTKQK